MRCPSSGPAAHGLPYPEFGEFVAVGARGVVDALVAADPCLVRHVLFTGLVEGVEDERSGEALGCVPCRDPVGLAVDDGAGVQESVAGGGAGQVGDVGGQDAAGPALPEVAVDLVGGDAGRPVLGDGMVGPVAAGEAGQPFAVHEAPVVSQKLVCEALFPAGC